MMLARQHRFEYSKREPRNKAAGRDGSFANKKVGEGALETSLFLHLVLFTITVPSASTISNRRISVQTAPARRRNNNHGRDN
jgi:hypothetical protein